jgi:uncharacterized protein
VRSVALVLLAGACSSGGGRADAGGAPGFDRLALLANLAENVIVPTLASFATEAVALEAAVTTSCVSDLAAAQDAWRAAATVWQRAELMRIGPAAAGDGALRDRIYSWPVVAGCPVDHEIMAWRQDPSAYDLSTKLANRRGLPALEYVLFNPSLASSCPPQSAPAGWSALTDDEKRAARCGYAAVAAADLRTQAQALHAAWTGGYAATLATAGSPFRNAHAAVNALSDALFVLDTEVKDHKLGRPAGITVGSCATLGAPCPQDVEAPWSAHSKENIAANLRGFQAIFTGGEGVGFDDFLVAAGAPELAARMGADVTAAIAAVEAIPGTLATAVTASPGEVRVAYDAVKQVTDSLKSQFLTVLALDLPNELGDDTD